jgi:hypothetical protein
MNTKKTEAPIVERRKSEPRYYKVKDRITGEVINVLASNRSQAENFASYRRFEITILTVREAIGLDPKTVFDATAEPGPPAQLGEPAP